MLLKGTINDQHYISLQNNKKLDIGNLVCIHCALLHRGESWTGKCGEVTSKRAEPGERETEVRGGLKEPLRGRDIHCGCL